MSGQRLNVLVYTGIGTTVDSVKHCLWSLRRLLSPNYAVTPISETAILKEPWTATCALVVIPGGADLGYCRVLNGEGNRRIQQYVNKGGAYLGLCAGGYYASGRCEFEEGKPNMAVVGDRELAFFPGPCRGLAYPGFIYHSEAGARAAEIKVNKLALTTLPLGSPDTFKAYYNGGGVFVDAASYHDRGVEVLAEFTDKVAVACGEGQAAVVYCKVGQGAAILTSPHPEFASVNLGKGEDNPDYPRIVGELSKDDKPRADFLKACLVKLGLKVNEDSSSVPSLSHLHLSSSKRDIAAHIYAAVESQCSTVSDHTLLKGENDTFAIDKYDTWSMADVKRSLMSEAPHEEAEKMYDYQHIVKQLVFHTSSLPGIKITPYFHHDAFFSNLEHFQSKTRGDAESFGQTLIYGEVVTSTNTMLEKNTALLETLPTGVTFTATTQVAGRGRGTNVWVSPPGSLMFSTVLRHPLSLNSTAPVVCVQYILALAIVYGIRSYDKGYASLPVRLKWPNDIYALDPQRPPPPPPASTPSPLSGSVGSRSSVAEGHTMSNAERAQYVKVGGILISTSYTPPPPGSDPGAAAYTLVCGAGINVANAAPTTSLDALAAAASLPPFSHEKLLASILVQFEVLYRRFSAAGFSGDLVRGYEKVWLHSGQIVEIEPGAVTSRSDAAGYSLSSMEERFIVRGISPELGLLVVEELVGWETGAGRPTGRRFELQSDSNSFDFFKGLVKRKA